MTNPTPGEATNPLQAEVALNAEQLVASMTTSMQTALTECNLSPIQLEDGSQERFVSVNPDSLDPSYIQLKETVSADGTTKTYEYGFNSYHDPEHTWGYRWNEGDVTIKRVMGDKKSPRQLEAQSEEDPTTFVGAASFKDGSQYFGFINANIASVPRLHKEQLRLQAQGTERDARQKGRIGTLLSKIALR